MVRTSGNNVNVTNIHPILKQFLEDMSSMFDGIVVTSGKDGQHAVWNSRHYIGLALDFGANSSNANAYANFRDYVMNKENKIALKQKYQIEDIIDEGNHIHVELVPSPKEKAIIYGSYVLVFGLALGISFYIYKKIMK